MQSPVGEAMGSNLIQHYWIGKSKMQRIWIYLVLSKPSGPILGMSYAMYLFPNNFP